MWLSVYTYMYAHTYTDIYIYVYIYIYGLYVYDKIHETKRPWTSKRARMCRSDCLDGGNERQNDINTSQFQFFFKSKVKKIKGNMIMRKVYMFLKWFLSLHIFS